MSDYRVKGAFFEKGGKGPAYTGFVEIDGVKTLISLWSKTSKAGQPYLQVSEDKKKNTNSSPSYETSQGNDPRGGYRQSDMDDDGEIPF